MPTTYPLLNGEITTPALTLARATDELLERLVPVVRAGVAREGEAPFEDPISLYLHSPHREWQWLRAIWAGRARADPQWWRFYFVVLVDGAPAGMRDLIGTDFAALEAVSTFSWLGAAKPAQVPGTGRAMEASRSPSAAARLLSP